jgi:hypothetical protein
MEASNACNPILFEPVIMSMLLFQAAKQNEAEK